MEKVGAGIQDGKQSDPGYGIRDKHPGSATLLFLQESEMVLQVLTYCFVVSWRMGAGWVCNCVCVRVELASFVDTTAQCRKT